MQRLDTQRIKLENNNYAILSTQDKKVDKLEKKYAFLAGERVTSLQTFMDEVMLEQAKIQEKVRRIELYTEAERKATHNIRNGSQ